MGISHAYSEHGDQHGEEEDVERRGVMHLGMSVLCWVVGEFAATGVSGPTRVEGGGTLKKYASSNAATGRDEMY